MSANGRASKSDEVRGELEKFAEDAPGNLRSIKSRLARGTFNFEEAKGVPIPKLNARGKKTGKYRPIVLAPVESRIVQRAILNVLLRVDALKKYAETPYSFGGIRGRKQSSADRKTRLEHLSAVPAAIQAVLREVEAGRQYVAFADISSFFTKISKSHVTQIVSGAVSDEEFVAFFRSAINVELRNLAELREKSPDFPTGDIGVAQGSSLSPFLGNIALADFDTKMNEGDCRCIRYIDDFIILAPTEKAANARLRRARQILNVLGMSLSAEKSSAGSFHVRDGFDFLGITILPGLIRPGEKARVKFLSSIEMMFSESVKAMRVHINGTPLERSKSLTHTLKSVDGKIDGWGKHYWFCNDIPTFKAMDTKITEAVRAYLGEYRAIRDVASEQQRPALLGLSELASQKRDPFSFPKGVT